ncbi:MAG: class I SAM-dependent methyltransferase [Caldilineaceae bacterium]
MQGLVESVNRFVALESTLSGNQQADYMAVNVATDTMNIEILNAERAGNSDAAIKAAIAPAYAVYGRSPFFHRMQSWPRGYPGDFETIEYLCDARNLAQPHTVAYYCEQSALAAHIVQQHRNKLHQQAHLALQTLLHGPAQPHLLSIACGGCRDLAPIATFLEPSHCRLTLNDMDCDALVLAKQRLAPLGDSCQIVQGNVLRKIREMAKLGPYDLILVGGLFDYLEDKHIVFLFKHCLESLLKPRGLLFCTNVTPDYPQKTWQRYFTNWTLIERTEADLQRLAQAAGFGIDDIRLTRDTTGVALLCTLTK